MQNLLKHPPGLTRFCAVCSSKSIPLPALSGAWRPRQYLPGPRRQLFMVNSRMVQQHFEEHYEHPALGGLCSAQRPFIRTFRGRRSAQAAGRGVRRVGDSRPDDPAGLFVAMNYRLKGLASCCDSMPYLDRARPSRLVVVGEADSGAYETPLARGSASPTASSFSAFGRIRVTKPLRRRLSRPSDLLRSSAPWSCSKPSAADCR